jgi:uncharacterized repeat protein (TIGR02543 family)
MKRKQLGALLGAVLCVGTLIGCKDLLHPEGPEECTVTFDLDGGNIGGYTATPKVTIESGDAVGSALPANPSRDGYIFSGWYTKKNGLDEPFYNTAKVTENTTVYAKWTTAAITITYNANGGVGTIPTSQTGTIGESVTLASGAGLTRDGYTFGGWLSGTGDSYSAGSSYSFTLDTTLYARWTADAGTPITITYNANGGTGTVPSPQTAASGASVQLASGGGLARDGYTFGGWNTSSSGGGDSYSAGTSYSFNSDTTLYAKWAASAGTSITITYNANGGGGTAPSPQTAASGASVQLASGGGLTRVGYTFGGWNTSASGGGDSYSVGTSYSFTSNTTLYAEWTAVVITITYSANGGTGTAPTSQTATSGASVQLASGDGLARIGYTFGGWNSSASGDGDSYSVGTSYSFASDTTLYAKWTAVQYTVTFDADGGSVKS